MSHLMHLLPILETIRIGDVQTDVHIVPVDSDSALSNLLILPTLRVALVQDIGILHPQRAPLHYRLCHGRYKV